VKGSSSNPKSSRRRGEVEARMIGLFIVGSTSLLH
jgi:hypothetical protein